MEKNKFKKSIKISFIVPARNEEEHIQSCIDSLIKQDYSNFQIIVVNDGSTDKTAEIVENYVKIDKRIKLFNFDKGHSAAFARNFGASKAEGDILSFVDSDAYVVKNFATAIVKNFEKFNLDGLSVKTLAASPTGFISNCIAAQRTLLWDNNNEKRTEYTTNTKALLSVFTNKTFKKLNGYREDIFYFEDSDLSNRFLEAKYHAVYEPSAKEFHHDPNSFNETIRQSKWFGRGIAHSLKAHGIKKISLIMPPVYTFCFGLQLVLLIISLLFFQTYVSYQITILAIYLLPLILYLIKMSIKSNDPIHSFGFGILFLIRNNYKFESLIRTLIKN